MLAILLLISNMLRPVNTWLDSLSLSLAYDMTSLLNIYIHYNSFRTPKRHSSAWPTTLMAFLMIAALLCFKTGQAQSTCTFTWDEPEVGAVSLCQVIYKPDDREIEFGKSKIEKHTKSLNSSLLPHLLLNLMFFLCSVLARLFWTLNRRFIRSTCSGYHHAQHSRS